MNNLFGLVSISKWPLARLVCNLKMSTGGDLGSFEGSLRKRYLGKHFRMLIGNESSRNCSISNRVDETRRKRDRDGSGDGDGDGN